MLSTEIYFKRRRAIILVIALVLIITFVIFCNEYGVILETLLPVIVLFVIMLILGFIMGAYYVLEHIAKKYRSQELYDCKTLLKELYNIDEESINKRSNGK